MVVNQLKVHPLSKVLVSDVNLHPYSVDEEEAGGQRSVYGGGGGGGGGELDEVWAAQVDINFDP